MKKHNKKIALILALALTLALAIPALANQTNIQGSYTATGKQVIKVEITGSSNVKAYLNPNGWDAYLVKKDTGEWDTSTWLKPSGDITTMPIVGVSTGESAVAVRAAVTSTQAGKFKFASSAPSQKQTSGLIWLEAKALGRSSENSAYNLKADATTKSKYYELDAAKVANALNEWGLVWMKTVGSGKDKTTVPVENWINYELFKTGKDATADEKQQAKDFKSAFNDLKKTAQKAKTDAQIAANPTGYLDEVVILKKGTAESKQQLCVVPAASEANPNYFIARLSGRLGEGETSFAKAWTSNEGFGASIIWTFQAMNKDVDTNAKDKPTK